MSVSASSGAVVQPVRARVKSTSSLQQPVIAQHFIIPPPASVPSSRRSTSSLSSTPPTPSAVDTLMPACPTGWARFDLSPLNEVTVDASSSAVSQTTAGELPAQTSSDTKQGTDDFEDAGNFAVFPSSSVHDDGDNAQLAVTEGHISNDKFSDSFLAVRDVESCEDVVKQEDSVVASTSFEMMSPSSDKDSISLPSPEAPPPPLPANILTAELPTEPPLPPPRPRPSANTGVVPVTPRSSARSDSVHSSPIQAPATVALVTKPPAPVTNTSVISNPSLHITSSGPKSRFTVEPSSAELSVNNSAQFRVAFPSEDATPPPLPPRHFSTSVDVQKQQLMRGTSLPASGKIRSIDDVPPPPPPRRSLSRTVASSFPVDPFAPIPVSVPVSSVLAKQQAAVAVTTTPPFPSNSSVVETTIAPLPRPRPHARQTQTISGEAASVAVAATSSGSSSPWQSVNTPPIIEPADPFSNVDPFAGSVSPDDPFAEPSLDGMLSDLCHDFDTDTLSTTAFRTRAVTIDSASSDISDAGAAACTTIYHQETSAVTSESRSSSHYNAADVSQTANTEAVGIGCLVDLNAAEDTDDAKWQPFSDNLTTSARSQGASGFALYEDLRDVWYSSGAVDWTSSAPAITSHLSDVVADVFNSSVSNVAEQPVNSASAQVPNMQPGVSKLDTCLIPVPTCGPGACTADAAVNSQLVTDGQTTHCSSQSLSVTSSTDQHSAVGLDHAASRSSRAVSEPPPALSQSRVISSVEQNNCTFDAVFGQFDESFTSWPAASAAAGGTSSLVSNADVAVNNAACFNDLSATSSVQSMQDNKQHDGNVTDQSATDVHVSHV